MTFKTDCFTKFSKQLSFVTTLVFVLLGVGISEAFADSRQVISLNDGWRIKPGTSLKKSAPWQKVTVPHTWNAQYRADSTYNRELMIYRRNLVVTPEMKGKRLFLRFEGVNSVCDVMLNHKTIRQHKGGYTAFCTEITDKVQEGDNLLEVWCSNAWRSDVLPISGDFNVFGGIHRPCQLIVTDQNCISPLFFASSGVLITQKNVTKDVAEFNVETKLRLVSDVTVRTTLLDATGKELMSKTDDVKYRAPRNKVMVDRNGQNFNQLFTLSKPHLWHGVRDPYLYTVRVEVMKDGKVVDSVSEQIGFRFFKMDPDKGFFLNGEPYDLHGVCRHETAYGKGSACTQEDYERDMNLITDLGATVMRLVHYPHSRPIFDLCDKTGVILWSEIPLCGPGGYDLTGYLGNHDLQQNAKQVAREMIYQNYNHPSVCFWGLFNEILLVDTLKEAKMIFEQWDDPVSFVKELNKLYHQLDSTRLTTFATCVDQKKYFDCSDIMCWNKYFGWNKGDRIGAFMDDVHAHNNGQPVGVSEYGYGGSFYAHRNLALNDDRPNGDHAEEHHQRSHELNWEALSARPYLAMKIIWQFADMQSVIRNEGGMFGINDKGLVREDRTPKESYYWYKAQWNPEPMLHLCGKRFTERVHELNEVRVYSTLKSAVTIYVNNKKIGTAKPDAFHRIVKNVNLQPGENVIRIEAKQGKQTYTDTATWTLTL